MSNLIKYPFVNMNGKSKVVIDNNKDTEKFVPFRENRVKIKTISEIEAEKALLSEKNPGGTGGEPKEAQEGDFKSGIPVTNFDKLFEEHQKRAEDDAGRIIERAQKEADRIRKDAAIAADAARANGYEEGRSQGYEEGIQAAEQEIQQREYEIAEAARSQQEEFQTCVAAIESRYVDIVVALVRKLTGVIIEDKDDLILYLIRTAAQELEPSENYRIRVSSDDIYFLEARRAELLDMIGEDVFVEFVEEKGLEKGQCIIETDSQMVDCGFQTQLDMLVRDLKMLVN